MQAFFESLFDNGHVVVPSADLANEKEILESIGVVCRFEEHQRLELPGPAPDVSQDAIRWSITMFYHASQCLVFRDIDAAQIEQDLADDCPSPQSASAHYSVDLTFRFLPDLVNRARHTSRDDPLLNYLTKWANDWPLSSVGISDAQPANIDAIAEHPCLLNLYVDRIIEHNDLSRLNDDRVNQAVKAALGAYPELAPEIATALNPPPSEELAE